MARTVPVYTYQAADGRSLRFAADSDFWITDMSGDDGLDIETKTGRPARRSQISPSVSAASP